MKWITAHDKTLHVQEKRVDADLNESADFSASFAAQAVHELLFDPVAGHTPPMFPALVAVRAALEKKLKQSKLTESKSQSLIWIDAAAALYPPAVMAHLASLRQFDLLRPAPQDVSWATAECLRCRHVTAVVSLMMHRPTRVEVRRLQLAAEQGGGVGILMRPNLPSAGPEIYAAATRWLVAPAPGERTIQRWKITQIHGHGRRTQASFVLEKHRATGETHFVHPPAAVAHHPLPAAVS